MNICILLLSTPYTSNPKKENYLFVVYILLSFISLNTDTIKTKNYIECMHTDLANKADSILLFSAILVSRGQISKSAYLSDPVWMIPK